jgi:hypothetical protein
MKTAFTLLVVTACTCVQGLEFSNRVATITCLDGRTYTNVILIRGDSNGLIWRKGASGGKICYTNLSPENLVALGIDQDLETATNRIVIANKEAVAKAIKESQYRRESEQWARQQEQEKFRQGEHEKRAPKPDSSSQSTSTKIAALEAQIEVDEEASAGAWNYYIDTPSDYSSTTASSRGGTTVDNAATRLATARAIDSKLRAERRLLRQLRGE